MPSQLPYVMLNIECGKMLTSCISWIKGIVRSQNTLSIEIKVNNIAYIVMVSSGRYPNLIIGSEIELEIVSEWHDDGAKLYGFKDLESKSTFLLLRSISGVGGRTALNILGLFTVAEFNQIILNKNSEKLKRTPKIGARLSLRIVSELQDKIKAELEQDTPLAEQARETMKNLGYSVSDIDKTITQLLSEYDCSEWNIQTWIKKGMKYLSADIIVNSSKTGT